MAQTASSEKRHFDKDASMGGRHRLTDGSIEERHFDIGRRLAGCGRCVWTLDPGRLGLGQIYWMALRRC